MSLPVIIINTAAAAFQSLCVLQLSPERSNIKLGCMVIFLPVKIHPKGYCLSVVLVNEWAFKIYQLIIRHKVHFHYNPLTRSLFL